jgi:hypothetical protein
MAKYTSEEESGTLFLASNFPGISAMQNQKPFIPRKASCS